MLVEKTSSPQIDPRLQVSFKGYDLSKYSSSDLGALMLIMSGYNQTEKPLQFLHITERLKFYDVMLRAMGVKSQLELNPRTKVPYEYTEDGLLDLKNCLCHVKPCDKEACPHKK
jgi:hypothetical protein